MSWRHVRTGAIDAIQGIAPSYAPTIRFVCEQAATGRTTPLEDRTRARSFDVVQLSVVDDEEASFKTRRFRARFEVRVLYVEGGAPNVADLEAMEGEDQEIILETLIDPDNFGAGVITQYGAGAPFNRRASPGKRLLVMPFDAIYYREPLEA